MASDSISLSAVHPAARLFYEVKVRAAELGCELLEDELNRATRKLVSVGQTLEATRDWCNLEDHERQASRSECARVTALPRDDGPERSDELGTREVPPNRRSGTAYDTATLEVERARGLAEVIWVLLGEPMIDEPTHILVTPVDLLRKELDYLDAAVEALHGGAQ